MIISAILTCIGIGGIAILEPGHSAADAGRRGRARQTSAVREDRTDSLNSRFPERSPNRCSARFYQ